MPNIESMLDYRLMLPSAAKNLLTEVLFSHFVSAGVNYRSEPRFKYNHALELLAGDMHEWIRRNILAECFNVAALKFDREHPLCWSNELQLSYRKEINDPT